jgi:peptide/nickel transport system ATP-binding protein
LKIFVISGNRGSGVHLIDNTGPPAGADAYLVVDDLRVRFATTDGEVKAVDGISFQVARGRTLGIVGESGSGKSVASMAILGLHNPRRATVSGRILVGGRDVVAMSEAEIRRLRGRDMAMIFQDPLSALHPYYTVGRQIIEAYRVHHRGSHAAARRRAIDMLGRVGIPEPARRIDAYPHEFSGGMRQRAMIAMALVNDPSLIIADEPTTALDVTVQAQILELLVDIQREFGSAIILITHDLGVVSQVAHDVLVMYGGRAVETGTVHDVLRAPQHPYAWGLLGSVPSLYDDPDADMRPIHGNPPSLINLPTGCAFHPRCTYYLGAGSPCDNLVPELIATTGPAASGGIARAVACHLPERDRVAIARELEEVSP